MSIHMVATGSKKKDWGEDQRSDIEIGKAVSYTSFGHRLQIDLSKLPKNVKYIKVAIYGD